MNIIWILLLFIPATLALPNLGNKTEEYKDCIKQCKYIYNPEYLRLGAELTRLVTWFQQGIIPDHEYMIERDRLDREIRNTVPIIRKQ